MQLHNPEQISNWILCKNPIGCPVVHYFDRSDTRINYSLDICDGCWFELLRLENYQHPYISTSSFIHKKNADSKPEANSL